MRLLLVDDETRVLEGLERLLYARDDWDVITASSAAEAIELLEVERFDVLVSDMRMPGMDGADLLAIARDQYPETVRIVLSGQSDDVASLRAARVAHQFLTKPCSADVFIPVVERAIALQRYLHDDVVRKALGRVDKLPAVPRIYMQLSEALDADRPAEEISAIIRQDPALAAKLLQLVNSSFFVRGRPMADVASAVVRLGVRIIRDLTLTVEVFGRATNHMPSCLSIEDLQMSALGTAQVAQKLVKPADHAVAFMAALLRDVGLLALAETAPDTLCEMYTEACKQRCPVSEIERATIGTGHGEIGAWVLGVWGLPLDIVEAVANHHTPERIVAAEMTVAAAVHIAGALVDGAEPDKTLVERIGLAKTMPGWRGLAKAVRR